MLHRYLQTQLFAFPGEHIPEYTQFHLAVASVNYHNHSKEFLHNSLANVQYINTSLSKNVGNGSNNANSVEPQHSNYNSLAFFHLLAS